MSRAEETMHSHQKLDGRLWSENFLGGLLLLL